MRQTPTSTPRLARSVPVGDGRRLIVSAAGPDDGFPVLYCHGAIGSPRWHLPHLDTVLERLGVRYLVVNRPGFGGSDPSPGRSVVAFARDIGEVMGVLGHQRFSSSTRAGNGTRRQPGPSLPAPLAAFGSSRPGAALASLCLRRMRLHGQTSAQAMIDDYRLPTGLGI